VLSIIDLFLLEGKKSLIRVALAMLKLIERQCLEYNYEECMTLLRTYYRDMTVDSQSLLETAFTFKITNSLLADLEKFYAVSKG